MQLPARVAGVREVFIPQGTQICTKLFWGMRGMQGMHVYPIQILIGGRGMRGMRLPARVARVRELFIPQGTQICTQLYRGYNSEKIIILIYRDVNISGRNKSARSINVTCKDKNMSGTNNSEKIIILTCTDVNISRRYKSERTIKVTCKDTNYERVF